MSRHDHVSRGRGDEFYTRYEDVERMLDQYLPKLSNKHVLCPCDTDDSAFVKYLTSKGVDTTWSNDLCYQQFDFAEYQYVITNPPFSLASDFLNRIGKAGCGGLVILPTPSVTNKPCVALISKGWRAFDEGAPQWFIRPDGTLGNVGCFFLTSFQSNVHQGTIRRKSQCSGAPIMTDQGIPRYRHSCEVPDRWDGEIAVPGSWVFPYFDPSKYRISLFSNEGVRDLTCDGRMLFASLFVECVEGAGSPGRRAAAGGDGETLARAS